MALIAPSRPRRPVLAALAATALLVGCGSGGSGDEPASEQARALDGAVKFAQCMRKHGVKMADPGSDGSIRISRTRGQGPNDREFEAAQTRCQKFLGQGRGKPDPQQEAAMRDRLVAYASCMRRHGVDMEDPKIDAHGGVRMLAAPLQGPGEGSASSRAAEDACRKLMPGPMGTERKGGPAGGESGPSLDAQSAEPVQ